MLNYLCIGEFFLFLNIFGFGYEEKKINYVFVIID